MSEPKKVIVEKVEFSMSDGKHVLWIKEESSWSVTVYLHNYDSKRFKTIGHLPTIENARYYADKFTDNENFKNLERKRAWEI